MKIRIVSEGFDSYIVERKNDKGEYVHWLPNEPGYFRTPFDALETARDERDYQIVRRCNRMGIGDSIEVEI